MPPLGCIQVDDDAYEPIAMACLRCGVETPMRFAGPCPSCIAELREKYKGEARAVEDVVYEPKMNVTPNAVALKDD
jgi:hypothetical protein